MTSYLTSPQFVSPQSTVALSLGSLHNPQTPAPSCCTFQGACIPVWDGCSKDCLILMPFRRPQMSCFPLSLKCFSSDSDNCPDVGIRPLLQFPHLLRAGPVLPTLLFFPQFLHLTEFYAALYTLFCWSGTPVCSQLVCQCTSVSEVYPWREMYSMSTYSSAI